MKRIAITGGIACGKSLVARYLNEFGVETIDADDIVHELIPDSAERKRIAAEVFADPEKRKALEAKLHPIVCERIDSFLSQDGEKIRCAIIPLLFECKWNTKYDIICCIRSTVAEQIRRMMEMRGYSREESLQRLGAQMPVEEKAAKSHYVINNDSTPAALKKETERFISWLTK